MVRQEDKAEFLGQLMDVFEDFLEEKKISFPETPDLMREAGCSEEEIQENAAILYGDNYYGIEDQIEEICKNWNIIESDEAQNPDSCKEQEMKALTEIRRIIARLGENSYVGTALEGCLEIAEDNIKNDFLCSMKQKLKMTENTLNSKINELNTVYEHLAQLRKMFSAMLTRFINCI